MEKLNKRFWQHRNVFVTGATGLLGSWLTQSLVQLGATVTVLIRDHVSKSNFHDLGLIDQVNIVFGDLEDQYLLERTMNEYEVQTVFHLAAQTIVGVANKNPLSTFESNIRGTWNLLEAARRCPTVTEIVVSTSDKAYGEQKKLPYQETMPLQGTHPYDVSKSCADLICQSYFTTYNLPVSVMRCANFFGGGDLNFNRLIPGTIRSVLLKERPTIRSDGKFIRDYLYVHDGVRAAMLVAEKFKSKKLAGEAFNFGMGLQMSALQLTKKILGLMKSSSLKPKILNQATHEIRRQYLSSLKAKKILGWKPVHSFDASLKETIEWYRDFHNL